MKKSLFLYLFIIAALMAVFTYAFFSKQSAADKLRFENATQKMRDSLLLLENQLADEQYFTLERNENAKEYLDVYDTAPLVGKITDQIIAMNTAPEGNMLVPYERINTQKFIVNKVKVLNHRWVIADFSDGTNWGELLLKYFVEQDGTVTFERIDSQLYQKRTE